MTLDRNRPVQTRSGVPVRIITWTEGSEKYPIIGFIGDDSTPDSWTAEGGFLYENHGFADENDLVNVPERKSLYVNCYKEGYTVCWTSRVAANAHKTNRIGLIRVDLEDDDIVDVDREL